MTKNSKGNNPYKITFERRDGYLYAYVHGKEDSYEISNAFWADIATYCKENCFSKVLVEEDFETDTSLLEKYELASHGHEAGLTSIKIAFIDRHPDQMKGNLFAETVACNRGLFGKVFSNVEEAVNWLLY
jgi:hypothetical protein